MRTKTRFLASIGIATAIAVPALMGTLAGCGLANGGIAVVGANPRDDGGAGGGRGISASASDAGPGAQSGGAALHGSGAFSTASVRATDAPGSAGASGAGGVGGAAGGNGAMGTTNGQGAGAGNRGASGQTQGAGTGAGDAGHGSVTCTVADLRLRVTLAGSTATRVGVKNGNGNKNVRRQRVTLVYTNISTSACVLRGYANVDFLRAGVGGPLSEPDTFARSVPIRRVELAPGGVARASAAFMTNDPRNTHGSHCDDAVAVRTFPPGSTVAIASGLRDAHGVTLRHFYVCGHGVVISALQP